ncbi:hypothetical protein [Photobacterium iliopiscarium]|jgi:hypothetical protein|uniref:Lipoprotein n=1 Tax=Photobacterium iliopiscarium TaxID=56192 RepID=A0A2T3MKS9_9GAMM|nr:hypothetical protein [Photobacterium iliopiscarium]KJG13470.1 hypothetical protein UB38_09430 [Photobacterium iliopiscarium]MCD9468009.1 hypothetical protein [Photobacterium iliopiscarium]MCD9487462.1 hypothetical protein [Photobacterium iliopiscarium]MCF2244178.1 hypothetical protein [Photobacterium iliopiscarium]PST96379.1 hypothetical protein C9I87_05115 [Photobacterium iliopiscarium]
MKKYAFVTALLLLAGCDITTETRLPPTAKDIEMCQQRIAVKTNYIVTAMSDNSVDNKSKDNRGWVYVNYQKDNNRGYLKFRCNVNYVEVWAAGAAMWTGL